MVGDEELARLAQLLRLGSETARAIAGVRAADERDIYAAADKALETAALLEKIARKSFDHSPHMQNATTRPS